MRASKRSVSQVVATVLLVLIVIFLIAIISLWSINFLRKNMRESREKLYCEQLELAIRQSCYNESMVRIVIKNIKDVVIEQGSMIRVEGDKADLEIPFEPFFTIDAFRSEQIDIPYDKDAIGNAKSVMFFPNTEFEGRQISCPGMKNEIEPC